MPRLRGGRPLWRLRAAARRGMSFRGSPLRNSSTCGCSGSARPTGWKGSSCGKRASLFTGSPREAPPLLFPSKRHRHRTRVCRGDRVPAGASQGKARAPVLQGRVRERTPRSWRRGCAASRPSPMNRISIPAWPPGSTSVSARRCSCLSPTPSSSCPHATGRRRLSRATPFEGRPPGRPREGQGARGL